MVSFAVNVRTNSSSQSNVAISLQMCNTQYCSDIFTYKDHISSADTAVTASMSGIIVDTTNTLGTSSLYLNLVSPSSLIIDDAMFSIVEI